MSALLDWLDQPQPPEQRRHSNPLGPDHVGEMTAILDVIQPYADRTVVPAIEELRALIQALESLGLTPEDSQRAVEAASQIRSWCREQGKGLSGRALADRATAIFNEPEISEKSRR